MIKNDKQYYLSKKALMRFLETLNDLLEAKDCDAFYKQVREDSIRGQIDTLEKEIQEYEKLKNSSLSHIYIDSITNIGEAIIKARIIRGWTQLELAQKIGIKEQQIQRYELCNYSTASVERINRIISVLELGLHTIKIRINFSEIFMKPPEISDLKLHEAFDLVKSRRSLFPLN